MKNLSKILGDPRFRVIFWSIFCAILLFRLIKAFSQGVFNDSEVLTGLIGGTIIGLIYLYFRFGFKPKGKADPAKVMREMREKWLMTSADRIGVKDFTGSAGIYGILMEENMGKFTATVLAALTGDASLYTTGTFGVIGGVGHEPVRNAARKFCFEAEKFFPQCKKVDAFPYPEGQDVVFYILSKGGVFSTVAKKTDIVSEKHALFPLYVAGQEVLTQLRLITQKPNTK